MFDVVENVLRQIVNVANDRLVDRRLDRSDEPIVASTWSWPPTCLMPGVTDTNFFERADMLDTKVGTQEDKADPAEVARIGFDAMILGEADVVAGLKNKLQVAMAGITPAEVLAEQHRKMAEPGSASKQ